jgi:hypothetical protein
MLALLVQVHALARNRSEAMKVLQDLKQLTKKRYVCSYEVATAYVLLREKDQAFRWFDEAVEERSDCMVALAVDPRLDSLRSTFRPALSGPPAPRRPAAVTAFSFLESSLKVLSSRRHVHPFVNNGVR